MVKFSKQFEAQLVPEWKEAFVDYRMLKKQIKIIQLLIRQQQEQQLQPQREQEFHGRMHAALSSLGNLFQGYFLHRTHQPDVIQVHRRDGGYKTEVVSGRFDETAEAEAAQEFFSALDEQLNKINRFYQNKEADFLQRGHALKEQLSILLQLKNDCDASYSSKSISSTHLQAHVQEQKDEGEEAQGKGDIEMQMQMNDDATEEDNSTEDDMTQWQETQQSNNNCNNSGGFAGAQKKQQQQGKKLRRTLGSFNSMGRNMRMDIPLTNPSRTISAITYLVWEDLVNGGSNTSNNRNKDSSSSSLRRRHLHHAQKMIKGAFIELYRGLGFLKTYRSLNMLAFAKILKKFDKVTGRQVLPVYLNVVERSYFNSSDEVVKLADEVEELFTQHFTNEDRTKAMRYLKPKQTKESHAITFFIGLFTGCFMALLIGYVIMAQIAGIYTRSKDPVYMETVFPVFSLLGLLSLHIFLYGCNIFLWRKYRINHVFIFEFSRRRELKYRDVFLICTCLMTIVVGSMLAHLALKAKRFSLFNVDTMPGFLLLAVIALLINPLNVVYRSTRYSFLKVMRNIILSPFYKIVMVDFFMADQLTSQVPLLRELEYVTCYYVTGRFKTYDYDMCKNNKQYRDLAYVVSFLPYYWRAMQCARKWFDEGDVNNLANLGKYVSAMVAAGARLTFEKQQSLPWMYLVVVTSAVATIYQLYWDFVKDWGLLRPRSKNPWLRDDLILKHKFPYFFSMGLNFVLRLAWLQTVLHSSFESVDKRITGLFLASLEVIRRGHWNFYRLENEHLNNVGGFRATKSVPLPFHEETDDD